MGRGPSAGGRTGGQAQRVLRLPVDRPRKFGAGRGAGRDGSPHFLGVGFLALVEGWQHED
jgi:hypothetical protein